MMDPQRRPGYIASIDDLQTGDVLLFQAPRKNLSWSEWISFGFVKFFQALVFQKHGHYDTAHAGVCVQDTQTNRKYLAHVVNGGFGHIALQRKQFQSTPFFVYRPKDLGMAHQIAQRAAYPADSVEEMKKIKWRGFVALKAFFSHARKTSGKAKAISKSTICSKFVAQVLKKAASEVKGVEEPLRYFPQLNSSSTPKALEAALYNNPNYELLCYPGIGDPYQRLKDVVEKELVRISETKNGFDKALAISSAFNQINIKLTSDDSPQSQGSSFEKALKLAEVMLPIFQKKRGVGLLAATSFKNFSLAMRDVGIFKRDLGVVTPDKTESSLKVGKSKT